MTAPTARAILDRSISEAEWQRTVVEYAERRGWLTFHDHDSRRDNAGFPDLVLVRRGRVVFAELKRQRGTMRREQETWLAALVVCAVEVYVWRPSDWDSVEELLR